MIWYIAVSAPMAYWEEFGLDFWKHKKKEQEKL